MSFESRLVLYALSMKGTSLWKKNLGINDQSGQNVNSFTSTKVLLFLVNL